MDNKKRIIKFLRNLAKATAKYEEKQRLKQQMDYQIDNIRLLSALKRKEELESEVSKLKGIISKLIEKDKISDLIKKEEEERIKNLQKELRKENSKTIKLKEKRELKKRLKILETKYKKLKGPYKKTELRRIGEKINFIKKKLSSNVIQ